MKITKEEAVLGFPECNGKFITYPCYVEAKLDGELGIYDAGRGNLYGKGGKCRADFPVTDSLNALCKAMKCSYIFGELYWDKGQAGQIYDLLSHYDDPALKFAVFDYDSELTYETRRAVLGSHIGAPAVDISLIPAMYVTNKEEFDEAFRHFTEDLKFEGVVVKNPNARLTLGSNSWVKVKKKETSDLLVISADPIKERVGLGFPDNPKKELCGMKVAGFKLAERNALVGKIVEVEYLQKLYKNGILTGLRNPNFKRVREDKSEVSF